MKPRERTENPFTSTVHQKLLNYYFVPSFLSISSESTEQHQNCVRSRPKTSCLWGKPDAEEESDMEETPTELPVADPSTEPQLQGNLFLEYNNSSGFFRKGHCPSYTPTDVGLMKGGNWTDLHYD